MYVDQMIWKHFLSSLHAHFSTISPVLVAILTCFCVMQWHLIISSAYRKVLACGSNNIGRPTDSDIFCLLHFLAASKHLSQFLASTKSLKPEDRGRHLESDTVSRLQECSTKHQNYIVANHELLGAIDPLFPPTRGFSSPVNVYIGHTELIRTSASVGDCFALSSGSSGCGKTGEGSNLIG